MEHILVITKSRGKLLLVPEVYVPGAAFSTGSYMYLVLVAQLAAPCGIRTVKSVERDTPGIQMHTHCQKCCTLCQTECSPGFKRRT